MGPLRCPRCDHALSFAKGGSAVTCTECALRCERLLVVELEETRALREEVGQRTMLAASLRAELERQLTVHEHQLRQRALAAAPEPPVTRVRPEPPPLPPTLPQPAPQVRKPKSPSTAPSLRGSPVWSRLGPVFAENLLFALGAFLLLAAAVFFVTTAWTTMSGSARLAVLVGGLEAFRGLLWVTARALSRDPSLRTTERVLSLVAMALSPLAAVVAGRLLAADPWLGAPLLLLVTASSAFGLHRYLRREQYVDPLLHSGTTALTFAAGLAVFGTGQPFATTALLATALVVLASRSATRGLLPRLLLAFPTITAAAHLAVDLARQGLPAAVAAAPLGALAAAFGCVLALEERRSEKPNTPRLITALALAITGTAAAAGQPSILLLAALAATCTGLIAARRLDSVLVFLGALALSAVTYLFLPAPVRELAAWLREQAAAGLGYTPERLPLSFYGISFLPYLGLLLCALRPLKRWTRPFDRALELWILTVATALGFMALTLGSDLRAPAAVLAANGVLLAVAGVLLRRPWFTGVGAAAILAGAVCACSWLEIDYDLVLVGFSAAGIALLVCARSLTNRGADRALCAVAGLLAAGLLFAVLLTDGVIAGAVATTLFVGTLCHGLGVPYLRLLVLLPLSRVAFLSGWDLSAAYLSAMVLWWLGWAIADLKRPWLVPGLRPITWLTAVPRGTVTAAGTCMLAAGLFPDMAAAANGLAPDDQFLFSTAAALVLATQVVLLGRIFPAYIAVLLWTLAGCCAAWTHGTAPIGVLAPLGGGGALLILAALRHLVLVRGALVILGRGLYLPAITATVLLTAWAVARRTAAALPPIEAPHGTITLAAALALAACAFLLLLPRPKSHYQDVLRPTLVVALGLALVAALDALAAPAQVYATVVVLCLLAGRWSLHQRGRTAAVLPFALAGAAVGVGFAHAVGRPSTADGWLFLANLLGCSALIWTVARRRDPLATVFFVLVLHQATAVALANGLCSMSEGLQPALAAALAGALVLAALWPGARLHRRATAAVAVVPWLLCAAQLFMHWLGFSGWATDAPRHTTVAAFAFLAAVLLTASPRHLRPWNAVASALIVSLHWHPVTAWLDPSMTGPVVEHALVLLVVAVVAGRGARPSLSAQAACTVGGVLVLLTALDAWCGSTTVIVLVVLAAVHATLTRRGVPVHALPACALLSVAVVTFVAWLIPPEQRTQVVLLPVSLLTAIALAILSRPLGAFLRAPSAAQPIAWTGSLVALVLAAMTLVETPPMGLAAGCAGALLVLAAAWWSRAKVRGNGAAVHCAVALAGLAYALLARHTPLLQVLEGWHGHVLVVAGMQAMFLARAGDPRCGHFLGLGMALPAAGLLWAFATQQGVTGILFLVAGQQMLAAVRSQRPGFAWSAAGFLNGAIGSMWLKYGITDPSFYGLPFGLTLMIGAEIARKSLSDGARTVLIGSGMAVLYGSVAVQVFRVEEPWHALVLFVLALATVAIGLWRGRNALAFGGTAAVILDVIAYLTRHGLQEDLFGAGLLAAAGAVVLWVATTTARRRSARE